MSIKGWELKMITNVFLTSLSVLVIALMGCTVSHEDADNGVLRVAEEVIQKPVCNRCELYQESVDIIRMVTGASGVQDYFKYQYSDVRAASLLRKLSYGESVRCRDERIEVMASIVQAVDSFHAMNMSSGAITKMLDVAVRPYYCEVLDDEN